jgi:hypothetical protein
MYAFTYLLLASASACFGAAAVEVVPGRGMPSLSELGLTSSQLFAMDSANGELSVFCLGETLIWQKPAPLRLGRDRTTLSR